MTENNQKNRPTIDPTFSANTFRFFFLGWLLLSAMLFFFDQSVEQPLPYSEFLDQLKAGNVKQVVVKGNEIHGSLKHPLQKNDVFKTSAFKSVIVPSDLTQLLVLQKDVKFEAREPANFLSVISSILMPLIIIWILVKATSKDGGGPVGGMLSFGRSRARVYMEEQIGVTFRDVAGVDEAKEELQELVTFLKEPQRYKRLGGKLPKGILLVGPPGTGKTLLARAVAGEAGVPFLSISGSEFVELFVGVGAARVRDLFVQAKAKSPCIIFIDELDALGKARGMTQLGGHDEKEQTLNQLLSELDGFDTTDGVILLAATNRPEILDPALLRAGRFDRQVLVDRPDKAGRIEILKVHFRNIVTSDKLNLDEIGGMTPGFSGADIANLVNESALLAARRNAPEVTPEDVFAAFERIVAGLEKKNRLLNEKEKTVVAFHEMGHALVAIALGDEEQIQKVSIIPRGIGALGYTLHKPTEDRFLMSSAELKKKITVLMGGRAAEVIKFGDTSTGAADDFVKATAIARNMVSRYGMNSEVGMVSYAEEQSQFLQDSLVENHSLSEQTRNEMDNAVKQLIQSAFDEALKILEARRELLERAAYILIDKETIGANELKAIVEEHSLASTTQGY